MNTSSDLTMSTDNGRQGASRAAAVLPAAPAPAFELRIASGQGAVAPQLPSAIGQLAASQRSEVTFIESNVADLKTLLQGMAAGAEVHLLDAAGDGLQQIAAILAGRSGIDAVHIISHGATAAVNFGALQLDGANLNTRSAELQAIGASLAPDGDILLYGCDVARGPDGAALVARLAIATGADVAGSSNLTGDALQGGDWELEISSGHIESRTVVDAALAALYSQVLAISSSTLAFNTAANFANMGDQANPATDVVYRVDANPAYQFKIDGRDRGIAFYNIPGKNYVVSDSVNGTGEGLLTFSFTGGQVFTPSSMTISNYQGSDVSQNLVFKGYDASGTLVGTQLITTAATTAFTPFALTGLTEIATLKLTATTGGNKAVYLAFKDIVLNNIHVPVDTTPPTVTSVTVPSNGTYKLGDQLDFTVNFSEAVNVDTSGGTPSIAVTLDTGGTVQAQYVSGSGGSALVFRYVAASGNVDANGVALGAALALNGGALQDAAGNNATLALNSVGALGGVLVDAVAPAVVSINRAGGAAATTNAASVVYTVTFSESVSGVGTSDFTLSTAGSVNGTISGVSGSGDTYTVTVSGVSGDGTMRLDLNGSGTGILDTAGNAIATTAYTGGQTYTLDHTGPAVASVGAPGDTIYTEGQQLDFTVNFSEAVSVTGTPRLAVVLDTGGTVYANYSSGSGGSALVFSYTVLNGQSDANGVGLGGAIDLNGGTLKDAAGNSASLNLNNVNSLIGVMVDAQGPQVTSITLVDAATTNLASVRYTVVFSEPVSGIDIGDFALSGSGVTGNISGLTGSGATYTVTVDTVSGNGTLRLDLNASGTGLVDGPNNPITGGYTAGAVYTIDQSGPGVSSVTGPANGSYKAGAALDFTVNFNEAVSVANGAPSIDVTLDTGGTVQAQYVSGSGASALVFRYIVGAGNMDANGVTLSGPIALNGASLKDGVGNDASLALNAIGALAGVLVDTEAPDLYQITRAGPQVNNGSTVLYNVKFTESVTGVDIGDFLLFTNGSAAGAIASISGSGADYVATINGVAGDGQLRLDFKGAATGIADLAGNAIPSAPRIGNQTYILDHSAPAVNSVAVPSNQTYPNGGVLDFTVNFGEATLVTGTPRIAITIDGPSTVYANYLSGSGTSALVFRYIVGNGQVDADGVALSGAIDLNGGSLQDGAGNNASLALNGVGALAGVLVNGVAPEVASISLVEAAVNNLGSVHYTVVFSSAVTGVDASDFLLGGSGVSGSVGAVTGSGTTWTVAVDNVSGNGTLRLDLKAGGTGIADLGGNPIGSGYTAGAAYTIDQAGPAVSAVLAPANATYLAGEHLDFTVNFNEAVLVSGTPSLAVTLDTGGTAQAQYLSSNGGNALVFRYTVASGHSDADGVALGGAIALNGGALKDAQGNNAALALNGVAALGGVRLDALAPTALSIVPAGPVQTNAASVAYTVTFSEAVSGVDSADFALVTGGTASGVIGLTSGSGTTYTVMVNTVGGDGALQLNLKNSGTGIADTAGNALAGGLTGQSYTSDRSAPTATLALSSTNLGAGQSALVTIIFSEAVTGFDLNDLSAGAGTLSNLSSADNITWTATLTPAADTLAVANTVTLNGAGVNDRAGNAGSGAPASPAYTVNTVPAPPVVNPPVVNPPATPGTSTVDGVVLSTTVTANPATGLNEVKIVIPVISSTRPDDPATPNPALADIPLGLRGTGAAGAVAVQLTVSLPTGTGLQVDGSTSLLSHDQALLDLIRRIEQKTAPGTAVQEEMTGQGKTFLQSLFGDVLVQSMTLTPTVAPGTTAPQTIFITGNSSTPASGAHNPGAIGLVIDASGLPANAVLQLNNVDFAAVVGNATLRGGDGQNVVIGDGAVQNILLGADDDLLFGGAGDDVIGSAGGNDWLDGGSGNDKVVGGIGNDTLKGDSGNDVLQGGRSDSGDWQFFIDRSGALVARHQLALFAPDQSETLARAELNAAAPDLSFLAAPQQKLLQLAGLYQAAFGRVADLQGLAFWATHGDSVQAIAAPMLASQEWRDAGNGALSDSAFVAKLYQQGLGRAPEAAGLAFWLGQLDGSGGAGLHSRAEVLVGFALGAELQGRIDSASGVAIGSGKVAQESGWIAGSGDDRFDGGSGNDLLVGGDGIDTVVYGGNLSGYKILLGTDGKVRIADSASGAVDTLSGIERGEFGGRTVDLSFTQADAATLRTVGLLYQSVLDRPGNLDGVIGWVGSHLNTLQLAQSFAGSDEFKARYAGSSDAQFVHALYQNTGVAGSAAAEGGWVDYLGTHTRAELIAQWVGTDGAAQAQFGANGLWLV